MTRLFVRLHSRAQSREIRTPERAIDDLTQGASAIPLRRLVGWAISRCKIYAFRPLLNGMRKARNSPVAACSHACGALEGCDLESYTALR
jgi:hypothetical protein